MGLDMYLNKKIYIGGKHKFNEVKGEINITKKEEKVNVDLNKVTYIIEEAGYWRKSNQIHNWFVKNVQDGVDNCGSYWVSTDKLKELLSLCKKVKEKAKVVTSEEGDEIIENWDDIEELLPSTEGFFFGSTTYDKWYLQDIDQTIKILEALNLDEECDIDYEYTSSW